MVEIQFKFSVHVELSLTSFGFRVKGERCENTKFLRTLNSPISQVTKL